MLVTVMEVPMMKGMMEGGGDRRNKEETCTEYLPSCRSGSALEVCQALSY